MKSRPEVNNLVVLKSTQDYDLVFDPACDPFAILDGIPNYFIMDRDTGKVEVVSNRLEHLKDIIDSIQKQRDEAAVEGILPH